MGFQQGLSGLKAASTSLDVIGNNIANASTVGFKQSTAQFSDIYALSMHTAAANQVGIGVSVMRVQQQFTQGNVTPSSQALDLAINGNGFFRFTDELGSVVYSRNGQLELTKEGYLVNGANHRLTGYMADDQGNIIPGAEQVIQLTMEYIDPKITNNVTSLLNFDSREAVPSATPFSINNPESFNHATAIDVYDSLGNMHVLQTFYVREGPDLGAGITESRWAVYAYVDGNYVDAAGNHSPDAGTVAPLGYLDFGADGLPIGALDASGAELDGYGTDQAVLALTVGVPAINGANAFSPKIDFSGTTQYGSNFAVNDNQQDGYASGRLTGFTVDDYGYVMGRYTNGETKTLAQICLVSFKNPNGLAPIGDNEWVETRESGAPIVGEPLTGMLGSINGYAIEESNVDLTEELVDMIVAQRVYQANAQTIKTEDQIMQTLVNLR
ncbi:flagellar hook protein FlgE [Oxalobacter sp. OttesenSCG-928-P03]|nr:flagellar hook protein FlgE [Oxalobacter sp. OttesenSCG-928-P03]